MSAAAGVRLLHGLCDEWDHRRQLLAALGGEPDRVTEVLTGDSGSTSGAGSGASTSESRHAEVAALVAMAG
jgi:hypothetical protein